MNSLLALPFVFLSCGGGGAKCSTTLPVFAARLGSTWDISGCKSRVKKPNVEIPNLAKRQIGLFGCFLALPGSLTLPLSCLSLGWPFTFGFLSKGVCAKARQSSSIVFMLSGHFVNQPPFKGALGPSFRTQVYVKISGYPREFFIASRPKIGRLRDFDSCGE